MTDFKAAREAMVDCQIRPSDVTKYPIIDAFLRVQRERYVPDDKKEVAYVGTEVAISGKRFLLDPRVFAKMLDSVNVRSDELVLDIGVGLGYSTAIIARIAEAVVALEDDASLANTAIENLEGDDVDNAVVVNTLLSSGAQKHGPYDVIFIQGGIEEFPEGLQNQLKDGGRVVAIFIDGSFGKVRLGTKSSGVITWRDEFDAHAPVLDGFTKAKGFSFA